jgi:hypothetical protein
MATIKKLVHGVGCLDADYSITRYGPPVRRDGGTHSPLIWRCPFYVVWTNMLRRGYCPIMKKSRPTYKDVSVCVEWHRFSVFKRWMEEQSWQGNQLDKDLLIRGNKIYNPSSCVFVSMQVNMFLLESTNTRGLYPIGVNIHKPTGAFKAQCHDPFKLQQAYLGLFPNVESAHQVWLSKKLEYAKRLAEIQTDERVAKALIERYTNF